MAKFILVNEVGNDIPLHLNVDKIITFRSEGAKRAGKSNLEYLGDKSHLIYVRESPEELLRLINAK